MKRIYLALGIYSTVFLLVAGFLGLRLHATPDAAWKSWHLQFGLFTAMFLCMVHSLIFVHLLGTGLGIKRAIDEHGLDEAAKRDLYRFKMKSFPPCMGTMVCAIATAVLGGATLNGASPDAHLALATITLLAHVVTVPLVVRQLGENELLLRKIERDVAARAATAGNSPQIAP